MTSDTWRRGAGAELRQGVCTAEAERQREGAGRRRRRADLLHVDAPAPDVGGDEHARVARAELGHDGVALLLRHVAVHGGDGEVGLTHLVGQPVDLVEVRER